MQDRFRGALVALAVGDTLGAPYEGGPVERLVWYVIGKTADGQRRWTDDTQMALDLAECLLDRDGLDQDALAQAFASGYRWSRGYGPGAAKVLLRVRRGEPWRAASRAIYAEGSYGNGGAMRSPAAALFCHAEPEQLRTLVRAATEVTHAHEVAIEGAQLVAEVTRRALGSLTPTSLLSGLEDEVVDRSLRRKLAVAHRWSASEAAPTTREIKDTLGSGMTAIDSCVTAIYVGASMLDSPLDDVLSSVRRIGGDVDTIGAMAAAIWGARNGYSRISERLTSALEDLDRLLRVSDALWRRVKARRASQRQERIP